MEYDCCRKEGDKECGKSSPCLIRVTLTASDRCVELYLRIHKILFSAIEHVSKICHADCRGKDDDVGGSHRQRQKKYDEGYRQRKANKHSVR